MADYDVQYDKTSGDWSAKRAGADRAAGRYDTQAEAHGAARGFAQRSGGGEVRDHPLPARKRRRAWGFRRAD